MSGFASGMILIGLVGLGIMFFVILVKLFIKVVRWIQ